jgi:hypothetical protein
LMSIDILTATPGATTKEEAVAILSGIRSAAIYGFVIDHDTRQSEIADKIRGQHFGFQGDDGEVIGVSLEELAIMIDDRESRRVIRSNYAIMLRTTLVRATHELVLMYCEESKQVDKYKAKPFFQFARIWRNVFSHRDGAILHMWPPDLTKAGITSVTWRGYTISNANVGQPVTMSPLQAFQLHNDVAEFLRHELA